MENVKNNTMCLCFYNQTFIELCLSEDYNWKANFAAPESTFI